MKGKKKQKEPAGMNPAEIFAALALLEKERGIPQSFMMEKIIQAITTAYKRDHEGVENVIVDVDEEHQDLKMFVQKNVVDEEDYVDPPNEMTLEEAKAVSARYEIGDVVNIPVDKMEFGLPQALNDDLLAVSGGDAPELHIVDGDVHQAADVRPPVFQQGLLQGDLRAGPLHLRHDLLLYIHLQILARLVHVHHHILHALVVLLVGGGQGLDDLIHHKGGRDAPLLFQKGQGGKNFIAFHILYS